VKTFYFGDMPIKLREGGDVAGSRGWMTLAKMPMIHGPIS
jgi:hypothetical protein